MGFLTRTMFVAGLSALACTSELAVDLSRVDGPRLLAVVATPAEAAPGESATLSALWVDDTGGEPTDPLAWSLCRTRRPLEELGPVANACIDEDEDAVVDLATGPTAVAEIPNDACRLFGPDPPPAEPGEPQGRPVEADRTGGYYQPVVVSGGDELIGYGVRLDCGVAGATQAQALELRRRHRANVSPTIAELSRVDGDDVLALDAVLSVAPGERVELRVSWPACAATPTCGDAACTLDEDPVACAVDCPAGAGCGGAEWYAFFDPVGLAIVEAREAMGLAWYVTGGELDVASTGRSAGDEEPTSDNVWTAPDGPGTVWLWIVLRDDRGGSSWRGLEIEISDPG